MNLEEIIAQCDRFDAEGKAQIIKHLLRDSSISIVIRNRNQDLQSEEIAQTLFAIADKISSKNFLRGN
ncbi:hypothetical protein SAMD00079811_78140 (plasmid) [Scytonema sp. HK-05]|uniref:hypothetical protein n=1 Tax=Scytonema sp. HK-05 TaxID=1137095 RepID=UPI000935FCF3|nr:hypothetical protein [Scytonema sp. HK-05]OKH56544.1 hypothetical protein NIES2130_24645 [Scytonema sp. HK-05]BAY50185.1 hypothetical protein SAMD00079811_78140 [Scytonema sp. HK-05]